MSIPHILTAAGASATPTLPINSKHFSSNSKEHIRERLNMHVKKRIQGQDIIPQYHSLPAAAAAAAAAASSSVYSTTPLSSALKPTHPFLMSSSLGFYLKCFNLKCILFDELLEFNCLLFFFRCFRDNATNGRICKFTHNRYIRLQQWYGPYDTITTN